MSRNLISKSLVLACLATTALIPGASHAKDADVYFYPKHKWTIERVNKDEADAAPICSLKNELNNGYIVQIAGTEDGFTNLNIDFRQSIFKKNNVYEVQYGLPGHSETLIPTKAFAKNLLVSDLRNEKSFSNGLTSSSVLDVKIQGNEFRMYLTGLNKALEDYTLCANPNAADTPAETIAMAPQEQLTPSVPADLTVPPKMTSSTAQQKAQSYSSADMPDHKKRPDPNRERYTDKIAQQLKEESNKYKPAAPITPQPKKVPIEIIEPEMKHAQAEEVLAEPKADKVASTVTTQVTKSSKAITHVTSTKTEETIDLTSMPQDKPKISAHKQQNNDDSATQFATIESAASPSKAMDNSHDDFVHVRDKVAQLERQVSLLTEKNSMLQQELKSTLQDAEQERISVASNNWDLERATMRYNEAERQIMRLGRQLQTQRAQCQIEKQKLETMLFDPELTNTQQLAKLASLEAELEAAEAEQYRQQRRYEEKIKILEEQLNAQ